MAEEPLPPATERSTEAEAMRILGKKFHEDLSARLRAVYNSPETARWGNGELVDMTINERNSDGFLMQTSPYIDRNSEPGRSQLKAFTAGQADAPIRFQYHYGSETSPDKDPASWYPYILDELVIQPDGTITGVKKRVSKSHDERQPLLIHTEDFAYKIDHTYKGDPVKPEIRVPAYNPKAREVSGWDAPPEAPAPSPPSGRFR